MTTNVDIFFKDLSASAPSVDRRDKYHVSTDKVREANDYNNVSKISENKYDYKDKKTFSDHVNEQTSDNDRNVTNDLKSTAPQKDHKKSESEATVSMNEQDVRSKNDPRVLVNEETNITTAQNTTIPEQQKAVTNSLNVALVNANEKENGIDLAASENQNKDAVVLIDKSGESSLYKENGHLTGAINNTPKTETLTSAASQVPVQENNKSIDIVSPNKEAGDENKNSIGLSINTNNTAGENKTIISNAIENEPKLNIVKEQNKPTPNTTQQDSTGIDEKTVKAETQNSEIITLSLSDDNGGILLENGSSPETEIKETTVPAAAMQNPVQVTKESALDDKSAQKISANQIDNASITNRQDQNNNHDASSNHRNDDTRNNNSPKDNTHGAKDATAAANNNSSQPSQPINIQNIIKSEITLDAGLAGQKTDSLLLQPVSLNGQTSLITGSVLSAQDINIHKPITDLAALMKPQENLNAKMVNDQITVAISQNALKGQHNFNIRLHPAELGQVDVKLEFMADGKVHASMMVENEKTLAMLQRDQAFLGRTLQDSGLNLSQNNLSFSLMKQNSQGNGQNSAYSNNTKNNSTETDSLLQPATMQEMRMRYSDQAIDISV